MPRKVKIKRNPADVSPKVSLPAAIGVVGAAIIAAFTGADAVAAAVAITAIAEAVIGYFTKDNAATVEAVVERSAPDRPLVE